MYQYSFEEQLTSSKALATIGPIQFRRVSHALVDTQFECGLRLPKALRACESLECRTRFERWDLTKGG